MLEFLKIIADRLRLWMLFFALGISILLFKVFDLDGWWMVFTFCVCYLVLLGGESIIKSCKHKLHIVRESEIQKAQQKTNDERIHERIWQHFNVLDEYNLTFVETIYNSKRDPNNPYVRYVQNGTYCTGYIKCRDEFKVQVDDRRYCWLLWPEEIGGSAVVTFNPYYLSLFAHYIETGRKEKV